MPTMLETVLVGQDRQHALEPLVGKLDHSAALLANQMFVIGLGGHRLVPFEAFAELLGPYQSTLHQEVQRAIHGGHSHLLATLLQLPSNRLHRQVVLGEEDHLGHQLALAGNWLTVLAEMSSETFEKGSSFSLIEAGHRTRQEPAEVKRTTGPELPTLEGVRRRSGARRPGGRGSGLPPARYPHPESSRQTFRAPCPVWRG